MLVRNLLQEDFVLNHLPFLRWEINYQMVRKTSQFMVCMELLRNSKVSQHVHSSFRTYFWHLNDLLQFLNPSLYFYLKINFASPPYYQLILFLVMIMSIFILLDLIVLYFSLSRLIYTPQLSSSCQVSFFWLSSIMYFISSISV